LATTQAARFLSRDTAYRSLIGDPIKVANKIANKNKCLLLARPM